MLGWRPRTGGSGRVRMVGEEVTLSWDLNDRKDQAGRKELGALEEWTEVSVAGVRQGHERGGSWLVLESSHVFGR